MSGEAEGGGIWWTIWGGSIIEMLRRAHDGEDPDLLYMELYANSDRTEDDDEEEFS